MERERGLEPPTSSLARKHSTTELLSRINIHEFTLLACWIPEVPRDARIILILPRTLEAGHGVITHDDTIYPPLCKGRKTPSMQVIQENRMAYTRKTSKQDIRTITLPKTPSVLPKTDQSSITRQPPLPHTNPYREMITIGTIALPLIIALGVASYYDTTHHWVIPVAQRILSVGK